MSGKCPLSRPRLRFTGRRCAIAVKSRWGVVVIGLEAPELARTARPGQFVMAVPPAGERAATALGVYEAQGGRVSLMLVVVGPRTRELASLPVGASSICSDRSATVSTSQRSAPTPALVAGGVGSRLAAASGASAARERCARRISTTALATRPRSSMPSALPALGCGVSLATDDGSRGHRGFVTELFVRERREHSAIAACGPSPMLRAIGKIAAERGVRAQLSLEETFACGVGACWGCVVPLSRASAQAPHFPAAGPGEARDFVHARICKEGPVFWSDELRW